MSGNLVLFVVMLRVGVNGIKGRGKKVIDWLEMLQLNEGGEVGVDWLLYSVRVCVLLCFFTEKMANLIWIKRRDEAPPFFLIDEKT